MYKSLLGVQRSAQFLFENFIYITKVKIKGQFLTVSEGNFDDFNFLKLSFWTFPELLCSCLEVLLAMFFKLKGPVLSIFYQLFLIHSFECWNFGRKVVRDLIPPVKLRYILFKGFSKKWGYVTCNVNPLGYY